ncbi:cell division protein FtsA [Gluconacetobacter johannae DSM 13595]|uniref:Cell division protein FtsA n=1 Tax=Gluconacetobacter johannae TaxID=112140 RepID=A0A7W4P744_9PROT|nr:cell division protein FtsA [Gluconacetobacter johannae]MBB2176535.1 cell division protein FtsA [Gluconacetobacter johannae]GBQ89828.1 cell division protein FtsA [Gluconacetobacter johannae DSM 13595]
MNDLIVAPPTGEQTPRPARRRRARRKDQQTALAAGGPEGSRVIALPPPDEPTPPHAWRPGTFGVLDIGSTKIICLIGRGEADGTLRVLGHGWRRSHGVKSGGIVDLRAAEAAIRAAVGQAEDAAERRLDKIYVNLSSGHPESRLFNVRWPVGGREITESDVRRVVTEGRMRAMSEGRSTIHTLPLDFSVDETAGVADPRGHLCDQLTSRLHVIDASTTALRNLETVLARAELKIEELVSAPLASGLSVLDAAERDLGVTVVDMGGGTTSIAIFGEGQLLHTACLPVGGQHVTRDIAHVLSTSIDSAEWLKTMYGSAELSADDDLDLLPVQLIGDDDHQFVKISRSKVVSIIRPRIEETLEMVRDRLESAGVGRATDGRVVLTGGASLLDGVGNMAARILNRQVRLGRPAGIRGLPEDPAAWPSFATSAGLLAWAAGGGGALGDIDFSEPRAPGMLRRLVEFIRDRV